MRDLRTLTRLLAVGVPVALLAGCNLLTDAKNTAPASDDPWEQSTNLDTPYGGYTFTDGSEAFGDPDVLKIESQEASLPVADADSVPNDSTFALRIVWGQLRGDRDATTELDWTGSVAVSRGALGVLRLIAFERPADHLLPRDNRQSVGFVSHTMPSFDGLLLLVHDVPGSDATTFTFATGPLTQTWTLADLRTANLVIPVDSLGNAVSITGTPLRRHPLCPSGFVRGQWLQREGERGVFRGVWLAANAVPVGHIRGHFGVNEAGERLWFGKILGRGGRLIGLARGSWEPSTDPSRPGGLFHGEWMARAGMRAGTVDGHYLPGREGAAGAAGFFEARWQAVCDGQPPQPEPQPPQP